MAIKLSLCYWYTWTREHSLESRGLPCCTELTTLPLGKQPDSYGTLTPLLVYPYIPISPSLPRKGDVLLICWSFSQIKGAPGSDTYNLQSPVQNANERPFAQNQGKDDAKDSNILFFSILLRPHSLLVMGFYLLLNVILSKENLKYEIISNAKYLIVITTKKLL